MTYGWIILHVDVFFSQRTKPPLSSGIFHGQRVHLPAWWKIEPPASWTTARNPKSGDACSLVRDPRGRSTRAVWRWKRRHVGGADYHVLGGKTRILWEQYRDFIYVFMEYITNNIWFGCVWKWGFDCLVQSGVLSACVDCWKFVQQFLF